MDHFDSLDPLGSAPRQEWEAALAGGGAALLKMELY
jgi:hypothetical protein